MKEKVKLIIGGATKFIYKTVQQEIFLDEVELIAFVDNNEEKWGLMYESIPVISPKELCTKEFDFIVIGALYSFKEIKKQFIQLGIEKRKIFPLVSLDNLRFLNKDTDRFSKEVFIKLWKEGNRICDMLSEVDAIDTIYEALPSFKEHEKNFHCSLLENRIIAHAGGGYVNGQKMEYTNSFEALTEAMENGFHIFECDIWGIQDDKMLCGSRLKMQYPIRINYTILSLEKMLEIIHHDAANKVILDIKYTTIDDFYRILEEIEKRVKEFEQVKGMCIRKQVLIETFEKNTTKYATGRGWECILTDYRNEQGTWFKKSAVICCQYKVSVVLIDANMAKRYFKYLKYFKEKNIDIIVYTVDTLESYACMKELGAISVLTNFLKPIK